LERSERSDQLLYSGQICFTLYSDFVLLSIYLVRGAVKKLEILAV
jgi:hypothetical protein